MNFDNYLLSRNISQIKTADTASEINKEEQKNDETLFNISQKKEKEIMELPSVEKKGLKGSKNKVELITLSNGEKYIFKPKSGESWRFRIFGKMKNLYLNEIACYKISQKLNFDLVPPTILRKEDGEIGSAQLFVDDAEPAANSEQEAKEEDLLKLKIFDFLIWNSDRHSSNFLIKDERIIAIDNGASLGEGGIPEFCDGIPLAGKSIPLELENNIEKFINNLEEMLKLEEDLLKLLGNETMVDAFFNRLKFLAKAIKDWHVMPEYLDHISKPPYHYRGVSYKNYYNPQI